jgi:glycolate oxidase
MRFDTPEQACFGVNKILAKARITPSALEFMEALALKKAYAYLGESPQGWDKHPNGAYLLVELDGNNLAGLWQDAEHIQTHLQDIISSEIMVADDANTQNQWWKVRKCIGRAVKLNTIYKEEDTVVPRARLADLFEQVKHISQRYGFESVCYGHAGDGNLHINILKGDLSETDWNEELPKAIREIFEYAVSVGGTVSGEHGIGWVQRSYLNIPLNSTHFGLFAGIKKSFDPFGILNPDKIW